MLDNLYRGGQDIGKTMQRSLAYLNHIPSKTETAREIWLQYFNNYLLGRNIITEEVWRNMRRMIAAHR